MPTSAIHADTFVCGLCIQQLSQLGSESIPFLLGVGQVLPQTVKALAAGSALPVVVLTVVADTL